MAAQSPFDTNQCIQYMKHDLERQKLLYYPTVNSAWQELLRDLKWGNLSSRQKVLEDTVHNAVHYRLEENQFHFPDYCRARNFLFQKIHEEQNIQNSSQFKISPTTSASRSNDSSFRSIIEQVYKVEEEIEWYLKKQNVYSAWQELKSDLQNRQWSMVPSRLQMFEGTFLIENRVSVDQSNYRRYSEFKKEIQKEIMKQQNLPQQGTFGEYSTANLPTTAPPVDMMSRSFNVQQCIQNMEAGINQYLKKTKVVNAWQDLKYRLQNQQWSLVPTRLKTFEDMFLKENKWVNWSAFPGYCEARNQIQEKINEHQSMSAHGSYVQNPTPNIPMKSSAEDARSQSQDLDPYHMNNIDRSAPIQDKDSALKTSNLWGLNNDFDNKTRIHDGSSTSDTSGGFSAAASSAPVDYSRDAAFMQKCIKWLGETVQHDDSTAVQNTIDVESGVSEQALQTAEIIREIHANFVQTKQQNVKVLHQITTLQTEITQMKQGYKQRRHQQTESSKKQTDDLQIEVRYLQQQLKAAEADKQYWMNRVSKVAGTKLTSNNPGITDLSDPNRPQKLAEKFGELYDNAWTDALEHLNQHTTSTEIENITRLALFLKSCYNYCHQLSKRHMNVLKNVLLNVHIDGNFKDNNREDVEIPKALVDARKETVEHGVNAVEQMVMKASERNFIEETELIPEFLKSCIHICWGMVVHEPKLCFCWPEVGNNKTVNPDQFTMYTRNGVGVEYVVWPALLLHENGPILRKGTYQPFLNVKRK